MLKTYYDEAAFFVMIKKNILLLRNRKYNYLIKACCILNVIKDNAAFGYVYYMQKSDMDEIIGIW